MTEKEKEKLRQEGRNQVLYIMLVIGDENMVHDNWHPVAADTLFKARVEIVKRFKRGTPDGVTRTPFPRQWPDFETYVPHSS